MKKFIVQNLIVALSAVIGISTIITVQMVFAAPPSAAPAGDPFYGNGPVGPQGPQGNTGNQGPQGSTGPQGSQGPTGLYGMGYCNWNGGRWISHGWDGGCAWNVGAYWYCDGSRLYHISAAQNGCGGWGYDPGPDT